MKFIQKNQSTVHKNSDTCTAYEYPLGDKDINAAVISIDGQYPAAGCVMNRVCKEIVYIINGSGKVVVEGSETLLNAGDMLLLLPGEKYYFDGKLEVLMPCTPAWYPEQHEEVEEF